MSILRRSTSMISPQVWEELDEQAKRVFQSALSARKIVDFVGPKGWSYGAHPLGRLFVDPQQSDPLKYGIHGVLPLVESRHSFWLDIWELDDITRGSRNPNLKPLEEAARAMAKFEEGIVYGGFEPAGIKGLTQAGSEDSIDFEIDEDEDAFGKRLLETLAAGLDKFRDRSVQGPFTLAACPSLWDTIYTRNECFPLSEKVKNITGGDIVRSTIEGTSYLLSRRGGDFEFVSGQDLSLGYDGREGTKVKFFFAESFTFNVINPEAVILLSHESQEAEA
jgi:uncharacterized linocin/CFP29 family protein